MAYVTFIHGLSNKPEATYLHELWKRKLATADGPPLDTLGVGSQMVYWADVLYESPDTDLAAYESELAGDEALRDAEDASPIDPAPLAEADRARLVRLAAALGVPPDAVVAESLSPAEREAVKRERIPLPAPLRNKLMSVLLRDAHHYFMDVKFSPRAGTTYQVGAELRRRFVEALTRVPASEGPHVVVSHSMGTMIAYDCLMHVPDCPPVDGLVTVGSPLGLDEVQDFFPKWSRRDGFPAAKLTGGWVNVYDRFDPVVGLDPNFANDFRREGREVVEDVNEQNWGTWRHSISKYLQGSKLRARLAGLLKLS
jgi:hypothetical protein